MTTTIRCTIQYNQLSRIELHDLSSEIQDIVGDDVFYFTGFTVYGDDSVDLQSLEFHLGTSTDAFAWCSQTIATLRPPAQFMHDSKGYYMAYPNAPQKYQKDKEILLYIQNLQSESTPCELTVLISGIVNPTYPIPQLFLLHKYLPARQTLQAVLGCQYIIVHRKDLHFEPDSDIGAIIDSYQYSDWKIYKLYICDRELCLTNDSDNYMMVIYATDK